MESREFKHICHHPNNTEWLNKTTGILSVVSATTLTGVATDIVDGNLNTVFATNTPNNGLVITMAKKYHVFEVRLIYSPL